MICHTIAMWSVMSISDGWRPDSIGYVDSDVYPLRCHWEFEQSEERCGTVLAAAELAPHRLVFAHRLSPPVGHIHRAALCDLALDSPM